MINSVIFKMWLVIVSSLCVSLYCLLFVYFAYDAVLNLPYGRCVVTLITKSWTAMNWVKALIFLLASAQICRLFIENNEIFDKRITRFLESGSRQDSLRTQRVTSNIPNSHKHTTLQSAATTTKKDILKFITYRTHIYKTSSLRHQATAQ
jgi:hypothetical protein